MLILDLEVLGNESRRRFDNLNNLVLEDQQLASQQVNLEEHLIRYTVHVSMVNFDRAIEQAI